jgi:LacI family transcriptional regulator
MGLVSITKPREDRFAVVVTMRDVAEVAGVSVATVSRVLSGARGVGASRTEAVERAAQQLGYRPNLLASSLRRSQTRSVAMVIPHIANPYFPRLVQAVERALAADDHELLLADSQDSPDVEGRRVRSLLERRVDGLLLVPCHEQHSAALLAEVDVPYVLLDRTVSGGSYDRVVIDDAAGVRSVIAHLRTRGRRTFAFVGAEPVTSTARARLETFRAEVGDGAPTYLSDFSLQWGREAAARLVAERLPDAVVCGNDLTAIGVQRGLRDAGVRLPDEVAVTGYDDVGFAEVSEPPLTTISQPVDELGDVAVRLLLERTRGETSAPRSVVLVPQLVVRASTTGVAS